MGKFFSQLTPSHQEFIGQQRIFFVATAPKEGRINLSPKGYDSFSVLGPNQVAFLNLVGSGNETAGHLLEDGRITVMFCAFAGDPLIMKLYGRGRSVHPGEAGWEELNARFPALPGKRQIVVIEVESVQTSCGEGVPLFDYVQDRANLLHWAEAKGEKGLASYQQKNNRLTIDDKPTGLPD